MARGSAACPRRSSRSGGRAGRRPAGSSRGAAAPPSVSTWSAKPCCSTLARISAGRRRWRAAAVSMLARARATSSSAERALAAVPAEVEQRAAFELAAARERHDRFAPGGQQLAMLFDQLVGDQGADADPVGRACPGRAGRRPHWPAKAGRARRAGRAGAPESRTMPRLSIPLTLPWEVSRGGHCGPIELVSAITDPFPATIRKKGQRYHGESARIRLSPGRRRPIFVLMRKWRSINALLYSAGDVPRL